MGVLGLWDVLYDSQLGVSRSFHNLSIEEGFKNNKSGRRAFRLGVDASLWFAHAPSATGGENAQLRFLYFRCLQLARHAYVPLFVFDGRERPPVKRGSKMGKAGSHALIPGFKKILACFEWSWREARGEAEAELARLNQEGIIDAVLTDDVDALIFGARTVMRNLSKNLTGNKSKPARDATGKTSEHHVMIYTSDALAQHGLDRAGLILFAMLCGGDYVKEGVKGFGKAVATGLARAGFGRQLLNIYALRDDPSYSVLIAQWRQSVQKELQENTRGLLGHKRPSLTLPASFPDLKILGYYVDPVTSRGQPAPHIRDTGVFCLPRLAAFCETHFGEWGYETTIIKRFRTLVWEAALFQLLRRAALQVDEQERASRLRRGDYDRDIRTVLRPTPADAHGLSESFVTRYLGPPERTGISDAFVNRPAPVIASHPTESKNVTQMKIVGNTRTHVSTDGLLEYRVEFTPTLFVELARLGISGKRGDPPPPSSRADTDPWDVDFGPESGRRAPKEPSKPPPLPESPQRMWVCAVMLEQVFPNLLDEAATARAGRKRAPRVSERARQGNSDHFSDGSSDVETLRAQSSPPPPPTRPQVSNPLRHTASQSFAGPSQVPARRAASPTRSLLQPTQSRVRSVASLSSKPKTGFLFTFPYTDDPDMLLLEDGLDMPLAPAPKHASRTQASSGTAGSSSSFSSQPSRRTSPSRFNPPVRRVASHLSRPSGNGRPQETSRNHEMGSDITNMFGGGDPDYADEVEPDVIRNASSATNSRMDQIFDTVFKPRGKGKGKAKTKRAAPALSASESHPAKKRKTAQPTPQKLPDSPSFSLPQPRRASPAPAAATATSRATGLARPSSGAGRSQVSRASSEVIIIDSDSDSDIDVTFPTRLSSPSIRFHSNDDSIIDLS